MGRREPWSTLEATQDRVERKMGIRRDRGQNRTQRDIKSNLASFFYNIYLIFYIWLTGHYLLDSIYIKCIKDHFIYKIKCLLTL